MAFSQPTLKTLWANSAGMCSFTECSKRLCLQGADKVSPYTIGEMAHIKGNKVGSNRHDSEQDKKERNSYNNLILLCPTHHTLIDKKENEEIYSVDILHQMKNVHETMILDRIFDNPLADKIGVASLITPHLAENYASWSNYGPTSQVAQKKPQNKQAHAIWESEKLSVIVPNNRKIAKIAHSHRSLFSPDEQKIIANFLIHKKSYEAWVTDDISYDEVVRFPKEFGELMESLSNGCV